ncbi:MAG: TIGR03016 family PEP-CTERM system-associated outer membrane protein [Methylococcaceae bacterium]|nr:TIGR03016 family PEP-CTERM system-associated outer membrane protein [Methylococcaceae bacterium]
MWPFLILIWGFTAGPAYAGKWFATPRVTVRETFSDNINLSPSGSRQSAFVTDISPGFNLRRFGGRTQVNLDYQMQNVINAGGTGGTRINHQLQAHAASVIEPNRLSISANSSISQQNVVNTGIISTGNLNNLANRANVYTFSVNPIWTPHFDGYANGFAILGYDFVGTSSTQVSDSNTFRGSLGLTSGYRFNRIRWRLGYNDSYSQRGAGGNLRLRDYSGEIRYNFNRKYSTFVQAGYFDNSLPNVVTSNNQNGSYYTFGASWTPSWRFGLQAAYGQNLYFIDSRWRPTSRTNIRLGFRHSNVGTNIGSVWNADITHQSARAFWNASYSENTTTVQNILLGQSILNPLITPGQFPFNPGNQPGTIPVVIQPFPSNLGLPTFTNNIVIQRLGQVSVSGGTAKSSLGLTLFNSRREDQSTLAEDNSIGASAFWTWRFQPRTNSRLLVSWNRNTTNIPSILVPNSQANFYLLSLGLTRNISDYFDIAKGIFGAIDYRYARQDSSNSQFSYTENSVAATLTINF